MKITDPEIIKTGERGLIEAVKGDLDWDAIGEIVKKKINLSSVDSTGGEIIVHGNQVAFRMDLVVKMDFSLMFDRDGNLIPDNDGSPEGQADEDPEFNPGQTEASTMEAILTPEAMETPESFTDTASLPMDGDENQQGSGIEMDELDLDDLELTDDGVSEPLDDDIDEILKESRDFWENKKTD